MLDGLEDLLDRLCLAFGLQNLRGPVSFGARDGGLLVAFGGQDPGLALPFGVETGGSFGPLGANLLSMASLMVMGGSMAPRAGGVVDHIAQLAVGRAAGGQRAL